MLLLVGCSEDGPRSARSPDPTPAPVAPPTVATGPADTTGPVVTTTAPEPRPAVRVDPTWELGLAEEFDGPRLDSGRWFTCYRFGSAESCTNPPNEELQGYVASHVTVADGTARLFADRRDVVVPVGDGRAGRFAFASGMLRSLHTFTYGYVEIRARVPFDAGIWPALWMLPASGEWPPEIDLMESFGSRDGTVGQRFHPVGARSLGNEVVLDDPDGWHLFAVLWTPDVIRWYVDGEPTFEITEGVPAEPMYVLANVAVGGRSTAPLDDETVFPATMELDHVRVWHP